MRKKYSFEEAKALARRFPTSNLPSGSNLTSRNGSVSGSAGYGRINLASSPEAFNRFTNVRDYMQAWELVPVAYSAMDLIASTGATYDYRVVDPRSKEVFNSYGQDSKNNDHLLQKFLQKPNPIQNYYEFVYTIYADLSVAGNVLLLKDDINLGTMLPGAIWPLPIERCLPMFNDGVFVGYGIQMGTTPQDIIFIPPQAVIHIMKPNPYSIYWGIGDIQVLSRPVNIDFLINEYTTQFFAQGATLSGVVSSKDSLSDDEFERIRREVKMELLGNRNAHKIAVMDNGMSFTPMQMALRDVGVEILTKQTTSQILMGFKVPGTKLGILEYAGYKADDADVTFNELCMAPRARMVEIGLNQLTNLFDRNGEPVSEEEMLTVVNGTIYQQKSKGVKFYYILPQKDIVRKKLIQATDAANLRYLTLSEQRKLGQIILGNLLTLDEDPDLDTIPVAVDMKVALASAKANAQKADAAVKTANKPTPAPQLPAGAAIQGNPTDKGGKNGKTNVGSAATKNGVNQSKSSKPATQPSKFNSDKKG